MAKMSLAGSFSLINKQCPVYRSRRFCSNSFARRRLVLPSRAKIAQGENISTTVASQPRGDNGIHSVPTEQQASAFPVLFTRGKLKSVVMAVKVLWCLGAVVIAAMLNPLPVESQCTAKHCYDDEEADVLKMFMFIQGSMERQEQQMASMKEELSLMKEEMSSMKDNLTVCLTKQDLRAYDCADLLRQGYTASGVYTIYIHGPTDTMEVYCDMETDGGGWLVFQRRQDGSVDFDREWDSYKRGFGSLSGEFWLGENAPISAPFLIMVSLCVVRHRFLCLYDRDRVGEIRKTPIS
ncbi:hypothetical protein LSAT2_029703 [Lamellibrachia satsuma]|nr:hypothetical protein LSAT2_029703 [Lamellibrachia satsuma]